jgi:hypothetical protein
VKNKYFYRSHISTKKFRHIIYLFSGDLTASQISKYSNCSRVTINKICTYVRKALVDYSNSTSPLSGEIEIDESYFGPRRVRGMRGRGAGKKIIVFGLLKRGSNVYTQIVKNASRETLKRIILERISSDSQVYSDS